MVRALHRAGIEVILDVVYNHTAEGNHQGPMLSFKGIDNATYYRPSSEDRRYYMDFTGTGNTLDPTHPSVLRLIMDSLRYFATECHVDGFRFDLAPTLARTFYEVDRLSSFLDAIHQDPVLSRLKLIAEPWDVGPGGYQVRGHSFLVLANAHHKPVTFTLPTPFAGTSWTTELATDPETTEQTRLAAGDTVELPVRAMVILRRNG